MDKYTSVNNENQILGIIMMDSSLMAIALQYGVHKSMFRNRINQNIYESMTELYSNQTGIDLTTLLSIRDEKLLGGISYLSGLISSVYSTQGFTDYIKILINNYQKDQIRELGQYITKRADQEEPQSIISEIQNKTLDLLSISASGKKDKAQRYAKYAEDKYKASKGEIEPNIKTGFRDIDTHVGGFKRGNYITLFSGSGIGKTTFAISLALSIAKKKYKVIYFTIEMTETEIIDKLQSQILEIDYKKITQAALTEDEIHKMDVTANRLLNLDLTIEDEITSSEELINQILFKSLKNEVDVVIVDYLNLYIGSSSVGNTLSEKLGQLAIDLKKLAQRNHICIIGLAQANRSAEQRINEDNPESFLLSKFDIQDTNRVFQHSNVVIALARNEKLDDPLHKEKLHEQGLLNYSSKDLTINPELMMLQVLKNRSGSKATIPLKYQGKYSKVSDFPRI